MTLIEMKTLNNLSITVQCMRRLVLCLFAGAHRRPGTKARILPDPQLFLVTFLKVYDLWISISIDSELHSIKTAQSAQNRNVDIND
jgi:hypothetical protein